MNFAWFAVQAPPMLASSMEGGATKYAAMNAVSKSGKRLAHALYAVEKIEKVVRNILL
jgi:hypothetical protein